MIKFNEVTWYSKLAAIIFFIGILPALAFYVGTQYQEAKHISETSLPESTIVKNNPVQTSSQPSSDSDWKAYIDSNFGFSLLYPPELKITTDDSSGVELKDISSNINPFTIKRTTEKGYDSNGKFGSVTYYYENGQWMVVGPLSERDGSQPPATPTKPSFFTTTGLAVFVGATPSHGWGRYSYIVALSHAKFLTIEGEDQDDVLINIVKSVKLKQ